MSSHKKEHLPTRQYQISSAPKSTASFSSHRTVTPSRSKHFGKEVQSTNVDQLLSNYQKAQAGRLITLQHFFLQRTQVLAIRFAQNINHNSSLLVSVLKATNFAMQFVEVTQGIFRFRNLFSNHSKAGSVEKEKQRAAI